MTLKCSVYLAASVDGFIARAGGDIEWLHRPEYAPAKLKGLTYEEFISSVDTIVMGRRTFEKALSFDRWYYEGTPVVVLTSRELAIPDPLRNKVRVFSGEPERIVGQLASEGGRHLYVDGGVTIQQFLKAKLIAEITITRIPILLGSGISLFGSTGDEQVLRLIAATVSENGFVQERYEVQSVGSAKVQV